MCVEDPFANLVTYIFKIVQLHILGVFYYVLGNIHPIFRSSLQCIQLIAVAKSSDIKNMGAVCFLSHL